MDFQTEHPAITAYFQNYPNTNRADVVLAAEAAGLTLAEYCRVLLSLDAVRGICVQFLGISHTVVLTGEEGHVLLSLAENQMQKVWDEHDDATLGIDAMAASMIRAVAVLVVEQLTEFLKTRKSHQSNWTNR